MYRIFTALFLAFFSLALCAQEKEFAGMKYVTTDTYAKATYSDWRESRTDGSPVMRERSGLITAGAEGTTTLSFTGRSIPVTWIAEATAGATYYVGSEMLTEKPRKAINGYAGIRVELTAHQNLMSRGHFSFGSSVGVGDAAFGKTAGPELWNALYARLGLETSFQVARTTVFLNGGLIQPVLVADVGLHTNIGFTDAVYLPHGKASAFGEIGVVTGRGKKLSLVYDTMNMSQSPVVRSYEIGGSRTLDLVQPNTRSYTLSLKFRYRFGH